MSEQTSDNCEHDWEWVPDAGEGIGDYWWCPTCGKFLWADDPAFQPRLRTGTDSRTTFVPFLPPGMRGVT